MSAIFQRPLCEMGAAYDFAFRPLVGDPGDGFGGGCDTRPHPVLFCAAASDPAHADALWRSYRLCDDHEQQLLRIAAAHRTRLGPGARIRPGPAAPAPGR